jgi:hypothetical protein
MCASLWIRGLVIIGVCVGVQGTDVSLEPICDIAIRQGDAWNIHSLVDTNHSILNIAMPEYSAEYWVTCVDAGVDAVVRGTFPPWVEFSSISVYDMAGDAIVGEGCHLDTYGTEGGDDGGGEFFVSVRDCVGRIDEPVAVVARYYGMMDKSGEYIRVDVDGEEGVVDERPSVTIETDGVLRTLTNCPRETSDTISNNIAGLARGILSQTLVQPSPADVALPFHTVPNTHQVGLFPNENSVYLVKFVNVSTATHVDLVGRIMCPASPDTSISFYGISVANTRTSETDDSLSWQVLGAGVGEDPIDSCDDMVGDGTYRVRVGKRGTVAGDTSMYILEWDPYNESPVIVVRFMMNPLNPWNQLMRVFLEHVRWIPAWISVRMGVPRVLVDL